MRRGFWNHGLNQLVIESVAEHDRVAANPFAFRVILKVLRHRRERAGQIEIVAVYETENLAGCFLDPFIDCLHLAAILFADPVGQVLFITTNDLDALISAATVDDYVFEIRILLIEDRQNRLFEKLFLIIGRGEDAELWRHYKKAGI